MLGSGSWSFTDPDTYQRSLREPRLDLVITQPGAFEARITRVMLSRLRLQRGQEKLSRVAFLSMGTGAVTVGFPAGPDAPPIWGGATVTLGDIAFYGRGEHVHQWTRGPCQWCFISVVQDSLEDFGRTVTGAVPTDLGRSTILRPSKADAEMLMRLHTRATRLATSRSTFLVHPEVTRALEHELLHALTRCMASPPAPGATEATPERAEIAVRFEGVLASHPDVPMRISDLSAAVGVDPRTLRICSQQFLGMDPAKYAGLRRLNLARRLIARCNPATTSLADLARRFGFYRLGYFETAYRDAFGESPSSALRRARGPAHDEDFA